MRWRSWFFGLAFFCLAVGGLAGSDVIANLPLPNAFPTARENAGAVGGKVEAEAQAAGPPVAESAPRGIEVRDGPSLPSFERKPLPAGSTLDASFYHGFFASFSVIVVSELGDKTWFIAIIMAMRHSRLTVFLGAMGALGLMTVLSACLGWVTQLIPRYITYYVSTALFAIFGLKMLHEGWHMSPNEGSEEFEEAQEEVRKREASNGAGDADDPLTRLEAGGHSVKRNSPRLMFMFFSAVFVEAFTLSFLAEWGDRSQLTTIILAAREDIYGVIIGGVLGHSLCTGIAVLGGKLVAQRISVRTVTLIGGVTFIIFALSALIFNQIEQQPLNV